MGPKTPGRKEKLAAKAAQLEAKKREEEEKEEQERLEQEKLLQLERERQAKRKKEETEIMEKLTRDEVLQDTCDYFQNLRETNFEHLLQIREYQEWERYVACDRLPYPNDVPSMNTYLYLWHKTKETGRMEFVFEKNEAMLALLNTLQDYIDEPLDASERKLNNWKEVRENYREELRNKLDLACFHLIRDVEARFNRINYWESEFEKSSENISLWMWVWMVRSVTPSSRSNPSKNFGTVTAKLPSSFANSPLILRILHTTFDHYSDRCITWEEPRNPIDHDLYDETTMWHSIKVDIISDKFESLQQAEEVPCWFEVPEEDLHLKTGSQELCESTALNGQETERSFEESESLTDIKDGKISNEISKRHKRELLEYIVDNREKIKEGSFQIAQESPEEKPKASRNLQVYVGTLPVPEKPEVYRITSEGEVDVVRTDGGLQIEPEEEELEIENEFEEWVSLSDPMEIQDEMEIFDILYYGGKLSNENNEGGKRLKTLPEMLREVSPKTGGLSYLNLSAEVKKSLSEILGISIPNEKKKTAAEYDDEKEKGFKSLNQHLQEAKARYMDAYKNELKVQIRENELNLRKFAILGGVYNIDLIKQVPQPHKHKDGTIVQINYGDYNISKEEFYFKYVPPMITEEEENDDEDAKAPVDDDIDKLIYVDIQVSETVLWFETPAPYLWDADNKAWSSENIYDVRFNEEKQMLSFRIGKTSPIGIASFKYYNLPYQTWEIRPAADWKDTKSIIFSLTASAVIVEYTIQADKVSLNSIQNATGAALDGILGIPFTPNQLIRIMRKAGLDLFPGWDAFLYVEGNSAKKKVLEEHVYMSMAMMASSYQFTWSRWNMPAGPDRIIFQAREYLKPKEQGSYKMLLNTTDRAVLVGCTEVSPSFSDNPASDIGFQTDLFNLLQSTASEKAKKRAKKANLDVAFTLYYMLLQTKMFSFS
ncbi:dynein axonemal intermediate chain 7-like [Halyomorpha halys]|uniref:dynein axonemal intermediate chain 7-like n=1 Tax=Halyomorpha halys TaxID=286706 RepID=UPI0034D22426